MRILKKFFLLVLTGSFSYVATSNVFASESDTSLTFELLQGKMDRELVCLAMNIYHEARGENAKGQSAIAAVTINRVNSAYYPDTVCEVVWQHKQFSWTLTAERFHTIKDIKAWEQAVVIGQLFMDGAQIVEVGKSTHYHANWAQPYWKHHGKLVAKVGNHSFYIL